MKKNIAIFMIILTYLISSGLAYGQWVSVLDNVTPVDIAISPDYIYDQTVYILDDDRRLWISETGGLNWVLLYETEYPSDPSQELLDIIVSPNYKNDDAIIMLHKDGTAELSSDRGQHWFIFPVPDGTTGIVFSPKFMDDYTLFAITGAYGPVKFYKSVNGGVTWSFVSDLGLGGGYYCRLWNCSDTASVNTMAVLYDNRAVYFTADAGLTWDNSFNAGVSVRDLVYSPGYSEDSTIFVADAAEIFKNEHGGNELSWVSSETFEGTYGIKFAISRGYHQDQVIFAAVDNVGIVRSNNGGESWSEFNDGFGSTLPISLAISQKESYTLYAGSLREGDQPERLWRYQTSSGTADNPLPVSPQFRNFPNPFTSETEITFEIKAAGHVRLILYNLAGQKLKILLDEYRDKGLYRVNLNCEEANLGPGVYFCHLGAGDSRQVLRLIVK